MGGTSDGRRILLRVQAGLQRRLFFCGHTGRETIYGNDGATGTAGTMSAVGRIRIMTSKQLREILTQTIDDRPREGRQYFHLCWWNDRLCCLPTMHTTEKHDIFFMAPDMVLDAGLSERQMELIGERVSDFCSRRRIRLTQARRRPSPLPALRHSRGYRSRTSTGPPSDSAGQLDRTTSPAERGRTPPDAAEESRCGSLPRDPPGCGHAEFKGRVKDDRNNRSKVLSLAFPIETPSKETTDEENVSI